MFLALAVVAAAFLWGFATASACSGVSNAKRTMVLNFFLAGAVGFVVSAFGFGAAIFVGAVSVFGSYTAARLPDDNKIKSYFNLLRR